MTSDLNTALKEGSRTTAVRLGVVQWTIVCGRADCDVCGAADGCGIAAEEFMEAGACESGVPAGGHPDGRAGGDTISQLECADLTYGVGAVEVTGAVWSGKRGADERAAADLERRDRRVHAGRRRGGLQDLLTHLYVLIPVLDREKHYWVEDDEVEKL
jgi:hypothetical protein